MASAKLKKKAAGANSFLSPEQTRTIKPADFKNHQKLKDLSQDDLIELLCLMEAELQAKDVLLKAVLCGNPGVALPLSHLLNDAESANLEEEKQESVFGEDEDEVWLGEPSAHLNHVSAYHQVVREQMHSIVQSLESQHKQVVNQLDEERHKHAQDTAQGDDVTYMLEKEREKLQIQVEWEQAKYMKLEKDHDSLLKMIETERGEQYNTFNNLMDDCKAFASQLVEQAGRFEKYQKEIDKEKQKNKLLSEVMVNETQKFKEKLKVYEDEVNDFYVLEQKKADLETKLLSSEKQCKETYRHLNEERNKNTKLRYQMNQLRRQLPPDFVYDFDDLGEEDVLLVQDKVEIPFRQARTSAIQLSNDNECESPEPSSVLPTEIGMQPAKMATVQKSSTIKQSNKVYLQQGKAVMMTVNNSHNPVVISYDQQKRHSYDEPKYTQDYVVDSELKRNSFESINHVSLESGHTAQIRSTNAIIKQKHSSCEEVRNVGTSQTPKRNSYEGDSKRVPPPAPPRRGSSLTTPDKPPIVKIPHQLQPRKSNTSNFSYGPSHGTNPGIFSLMVVVVCDYGQDILRDGMDDERQLYDFLSFLHVKKTCTWYELTCLINECFEKNCPVLLNEHEGVSSNSIQHYEFGNVTWTMDRHPDANLQKLLTKHNSQVLITLKGAENDSLDSLSYSTMMSIQSLEECIRIIYQEKKLLLTVNRLLEAEHFLTCLCNWIKSRETKSSNGCTIIKIGNQENSDLTMLTNHLFRQGLLQMGVESDLEQKFLLLLNIDHLESEGLTSIIFDWLSYSSHLLKGYHGDEESCYLHKDVLVIGYATNERLSTLAQVAYRLFKIMSLPSLLPDLVYRWLSQQLIKYPADLALELHMLDTVKWLSNVYQNLQKSFYKIELSHKLPDISVYMEASLTDREELYNWIKNLWSESITPCVEDSVRQRTGASTDAQQELLIRATLRALYEKSIRPGCPIDLNL